MGEAEVQLATGTGPLDVPEQLVVVQALPALAVVALQLATGVGPAFAVAQVVVV